MGAPARHPAPCGIPRHRQPPIAGERHPRENNSVPSPSASRVRRNRATTGLRLHRGSASTPDTTAPVSRETPRLTLLRNDGVPIATHARLREQAARFYPSIAPGWQPILQRTASGDAWLPTREGDAIVADRAALLFLLAPLHFHDHGKHGVLLR